MFSFMEMFKGLIETDPKLVGIMAVGIMMLLFCGWLGLLAGECNIIVAIFGAIVATFISCGVIFVMVGCVDLCLMFLGFIAGLFRT